MNIYAVMASFLGTGVELVEALTIVLAVGVVRGFKSSILGAVFAAVVLGILIMLVGAPLVHLIQLFFIQLIVGLLMLLFGIRWLRKAIMRYAGLKTLHNEQDSYEQELIRQRQAGAVATGIDKFAFMTAFSGTFLEGLEAVFIVITFGLSAKAMSSSVLGALIAAVVVVLAGILLRNPLTKVPENTMKFLVGVMLTSFGAFWLGESFGVKWPQADLSVLYMVISLLLLSWLIIIRSKSVLKKRTVAGTTMGVR
jgi:uncharacterized membrane protein